MYTCFQTHGISYSELSHCWRIELNYGEGEKKTKKSSSPYAHITLGIADYKRLCIGRWMLIYEGCAVTVCSVWIRIFIAIVFDAHWHPWDESRAFGISAYLKLQQLSPSFVPGGCCQSLRTVHVRSVPGGCSDADLDIWPAFVWRNRRRHHKTIYNTKCSTLSSILRDNRMITYSKRDQSTQNRNNHFWSVRCILFFLQIRFLCEIVWVVKQHKT